MLSKRSPLYVLRHRNFRLLWIGLLISRIGSEMQVMAIAWHVYLLTGSALSLGLIGLFRFLPIALFSLVGGVAADIFDRKKVMLIVQIVMTAAASVLAVATFTHTITPTLIYLMILAFGVGTAFELPARQSAIPGLVPKDEFVRATGLGITNLQSAIFIGPAIGGFIIAAWGVGSVYLINAISFIAVIIALPMMDPLERSHEIRSDFNLASIKEGLSYVIRTPLIYSTMLLDFFATFFASATVLIPIYAKDILRVGPQGLGFLYAAPAVGAILAGLFTSTHGHLKNQGKILLISVSMYGLASVLFGVSRFFYASLFFLMIGGAGDAVSSVIRNSIRQLRTPDYIRGRMVSINQIFFIGGPQLGEVEAGLVAGFWGAPFAVVTGGLATIVLTAAIARLVPSLRKYKNEELSMV